MVVVFKITARTQSSPFDEDAIRCLRQIRLAPLCAESVLWPLSKISPKDQLKYVGNNKRDCECEGIYAPIRTIFRRARLLNFLPPILKLLAGD